MKINFDVSFNACPTIKIHILNTTESVVLVINENKTAKTRTTKASMNEKYIVHIKSFSKSPPWSINKIILSEPSIKVLISKKLDKPSIFPIKKEGLEIGLEIII